MPEDKLLYLYHFASFAVDNCNGMTGPRAGLVAKINQVRAVVLLLCSFVTVVSADRHCPSDTHRRTRPIIPSNTFPTSAGHKIWICPHQQLAPHSPVAK